MNDDIETLDEVTRDARGRWLSGGASPNPRGRPRGAKNKTPRRRADPERAADWTRHDWQVYFRRTAQAADGTVEERLAAAASEATALWLILHPPIQQPGRCAHCGQTLDPPRATADAAPIRLDGAWVHFGCGRWFLWARWSAAKAGLQRLGISIADV